MDLPQQTIGHEARLPLDIDADAVSWELFDENDFSIATGEAEAVSPGAFIVSIQPEFLVLPDNVSREGRRIELTIAKNGSQSTASEYFVLTSTQPLQLLQNTLQSYAKAIAVRSTFGLTLDGWDATDDHNLRISALIDAYRRLSRMTFRVNMMAGRNGQDYLSDHDVRKFKLDIIDSAEFMAMPQDFREAICRAQVVEADAVLGGDVLAGRRRDGVVQEVVGEASITFSKLPMLDMPISAAAYAEIRRYCVFGVGVARS